MLVITRGYMKPIITTTFEAHPRFTILSMDWFVGEKLHRKPWFLPSNWSGFSVNMFPSSNSMILSWHHLSDFGRKKNGVGPSKHQEVQWQQMMRTLGVFFPDVRSCTLLGYPSDLPEICLKILIGSIFWKVCQLEQIKRANRAAQIKPLGWRWRTTTGKATWSVLAMTAALRRLWFFHRQIFLRDLGHFEEPSCSMVWDSLRMLKKSVLEAGIESKYRMNLHKQDWYTVRWCEKNNIGLAEPPSSKELSQEEYRTIFLISEDVQHPSAPWYLKGWSSWWMDTGRMMAGSLVGSLQSHVCQWSRNNYHVTLIQPWLPNYPIHIIKI